MSNRKILKFPHYVKIPWIQLLPTRKKEEECNELSATQFYVKSIFDGLNQIHWFWHWVIEKLLFIVWKINNNSVSQIFCKFFGLASLSSHPGSYELETPKTLINFLGKNFYLQITFILRWTRKIWISCQTLNCNI